MSFSNKLLIELKVFWDGRKKQKEQNSLSFPKDNGENTLKTETADIAIKGGICVNSREMRKADIFIKDGLIDSIESGDSARPALKVIDASEKFVLPKGEFKMVFDLNGLVHDDKKVSLSIEVPAISLVVLVKTGN